MLTEPLRRKGFHTLRFNARGVGSSTGWSSLTGVSEGKDLEALVQWALDQIINVQSLVLIVSPKVTLWRLIAKYFRAIHTGH
jgi:alpha/beta superfamily hydrolase